MNSVIYNVPAELFSEYRGRRVIVRSLDPGEIVQMLSGEDLDNVQYVQLLSAGIDPEALAPLANWGRDVPMEIVISDPASEFPLLYNFSKLLDKHPIRVSITVRPGFLKAVKLALALQFTVKLDVGQPDTSLIEEMKEALDLYLHGANVSQPVECFHSIFLSFYRQEPASVWFIQEEDPEHFRFISDDGIETVSQRFAGVDPTAERDAATAREALECDTCQFMAVCGGYFKWPDRNYSCEGVKAVFGTINAAAAELKQTVDSMK
jgi:hypothetical protein